ncbi:uncharacterized protein LOC144599354 [Rhinoraja longicauda]
MAAMERRRERDNLLARELSRGQFGENVQPHEADLQMGQLSTGTCRGLRVPGSPQACGWSSPVDHRQRDRKHHDDIDECGTNTSNCEQVCTNTNGSFVCSCYLGFSTNVTNSSLCDDIDECATSTSNCQQICTNAIGSFICSCVPGFSIDEANPLHCVDIDECATKTSNCQQICTNVIGSFICSCDPGLSIDEANPSFCVASTTFASAAATRSTEQSTTMTPYTTESTSTVPEPSTTATASTEPPPAGVGAATRPKLTCCPCQSGPDQRKIPTEQDLHPQRLLHHPWIGLLTAHRILA